MRIINSLWPNDSIWLSRSMSTLALIMACCVTAPSLHLNQCWLPFSDILWYSPASNFTRCAHQLNRFHILWDYTLIVIAASPRGHWVNRNCYTRYVIACLMQFCWANKHRQTQWWLQRYATFEAKWCIYASVNCEAPNHYLNHWWVIGYWKIKNKFEGLNLNKNTPYFIQENAF